MKSTTIIDGEKYITINGMTFLQFCNEVNGFDFVRRTTGTQVFRWQLFWNGIKPEALLSGKTKYKAKFKN
jgi:hypothetical protein